jgi:tetratricopeptide (TPR) repeat protein
MAVFPKILLALFGLISGFALMAAENAINCQMLLNQEQIEQGEFDRQRRMYPKASAQRLSQQAAQAGFASKDPETAMSKFNQAWRFDPKNPMAYWGAGIIRGWEAENASNEELRRNCWRDCVKLFEQAAALMTEQSDTTLQENFALDYAETRLQYGIFLQKENPTEAEQAFRQAEKRLKPLADRVPEQTARNRALIARASRQLSRLYTAEKRQEEAARYAKQAETMKGQMQGENKK